MSRICANSSSGTDIYYSGLNRVLQLQVQKTQMDFDTFDTDLFSEINDTQAEIYDIIEYDEDGKNDNKKFDVEGYINGNTDY